MFTSALFRRIFVPLLLIVLGYSAALYAISAPIIRATALRAETNSARIALDNLYALSLTQNQDVLAYEHSAMESYKRQLKNMLALAMGFLTRYHALAQSGSLSEEDARKAFLSQISRTRYGNDDYFWVADYSGRMLSHPDPSMSGQDFSQIKDARGHFFLPTLIREARANPDGAYVNYWWTRLSGGTDREKLAYARDFPPWQWVLGTGVYVDDVQKEVNRRREEMTLALRGVLAGLSMGRTGYAFIYDAKLKRIIHPDPSVSSPQEFLKVNPKTGRSLLSDLMAAADTPGKTVSYVWDRPGDKGNYEYECVSFVRRFEPTDWYIVTTVYLEEIEKTAVQLRSRVLAAASLLYLGLIVVAALFLRGILAPVGKLSKMARSIESGNLQVQAEVSGKGELSFLAAAMNSMVERLRQNMERLDQMVLARTAELDEKNEKLEKEIEARTRAQTELTETNEKLSRWVSELERRNREIAVLNNLGDLLQAASTEKDAFDVVAEAALELFPQEAGALFLYGKGKIRLDPAVSWGTFSGTWTRLLPESCWAVRRGRMHIMDEPERIRPCGQCSVSEGSGYLCAPLVAQGEVLGVLHLRFPLAGQELTEGQRTRMRENRRRLALALAEHLSLAIANIRLRDRLRELSVRDPLTGLFNRRYMEESLLREIRTAEREGSTLGIIMMDVDHFKDFNDTYGHEAGDRVLSRLGALLAHGVRSGDVACRYGGEEFLLILPGASLSAAADRAGNLARAIETDLFRQVEGCSVPITISAGVSVFPDHGKTPDELINAADAAMYQAKRLGRNRVMGA
ncbi:MAG: cache domain-containing protein [Thermodesulfobacteriota bacterium]